MVRVLEYRTRLIYAVMIALLLAVLVGPQQALAARTCTIRYYVSPMVGSGTEEDPLRPLVIDLPNYPKKTVATAWEYVYDAERRPYALVAVASTNHKLLVKNPELGAFPYFPLHLTIWEMSPEQWNTVLEIFDRFDLNEEVLSESALYSDIFFFLAREIVPQHIDPGNPLPTLDTCPLK